MNVTSNQKMDRSHIYGIQILFVAGIIFGSQSVVGLEKQHLWTVARYVVYLLTVQATKGLSVIVYDVVNNHKALNAKAFRKVNRDHVITYVVCVVLLIFNNQQIYTADFAYIFVAYLIVKYPEVDKKKGATINYGTGMALSFIEGYLVHIIPSDGGKFVGFLENIRAFESRQGIVFPVKKLFIIINKSMSCPPDLKGFNDNSEKEVARLESCKKSDMFQSLENIEKDVAGVKRRIYKNSAYKITRPDKRPVYITAECATPLHTLYRVVSNRNLYEADVNVEEIMSDFITMLTTALPKNPDLRGKYEIIIFDDTNPKLNLADVLLDKIRELEPNFEEIINRRK